MTVGGRDAFLALHLKILAGGASIALAACGGTSDVLFAADGTEPGAIAAPLDSGLLTDSRSPSSSTDAGTSQPGDTGTPTNDAPESDAALGEAPASDATVSDAPASKGASNDAPAGDSAEGAADASDLVAKLRAITANCAIASKGTYRTDRSSLAAVNICALNGAFFWTADLAIDCDGQITAQCNTSTDATFSAETSVTQSNGQPLIASQLPYVSIPLPGTRFNYAQQGIEPGALAVVIYGNRLAYAIFGDESPSNVIGEASYAVAVSLGLDPNPNTGGTAGPVTYIVLTGIGAVANPVEERASAVTLAGALLPRLISNN